MSATLTYSPMSPQNPTKVLRAATHHPRGRYPYTRGAPLPPTAHYSLLTANSLSYTFSAKEKDSETGLSYFGSRYYSSDLSIWLSVDPMSDKYPSLSSYVYCADNPVKLVDEITGSQILESCGYYYNGDINRGIPLLDVSRYLRHQAWKAHKRH